MRQGKVYTQHATLKNFSKVHSFAEMQLILDEIRENEDQSYMQESKRATAGEKDFVLKLQ
jgi:hypothetical protein